MSAIVAALGVVGNLWSALRSAPPPHPVRSLSQEGTRTRTSGGSSSSSGSSSVVGESILSESDSEEAVGKLLRFRILPRRIHWCVWTLDYAQTEALALKRTGRTGRGGAGRRRGLDWRRRHPPRHQSMSWWAVAGKRNGSLFLLRRCIVIAFWRRWMGSLSLFFGPLSVSLFLCVSIPSFPFLRPDEFWLIYVCVCLARGKRFVLRLGGEEKWYHTRIQFGDLLFVAAVMMYFDDNISLVDCRW